MNLTCRPGDLALVKSGVPVENIGRVIRVQTLMSWSGIPCWTYEGELVGHAGGHCPAVADECLRPIRGQDGDDETLTWAGRPATHDAPVAA